METTLLIARLLLASIFVVAGAAKLSDRAGSRQTMIDFGMPASVTAPLGVLLPLVELAVAAALVFTPTAWWGAVAALTLLLLFIAGISLNMARGRKLDCHCFGQLHSAPAGRRTLARNGFLASVAGFVVWQAYDSALPSALSRIGEFTTVQLAFLVLAVATLAILGLLAVHWSRKGALAQSPVGPPVGSQAPPFVLKGFDGETLSLDSLRASGRPVMLLFISPDCSTCAGLLPDVSRWQKEYAQKLTMVLVSGGTFEENRSQVSEHDLTNFLLQDNWEVAQTYRLRGSPSAVLVHPDGTIGSPMVEGIKAIRILVAQAIGYDI